MKHHLKFYIDGAWVDPISQQTTEVFNPATEKPISRIAFRKLPDADFNTAITSGVRTMMINTGQSCNSPSRMLVSKVRMDEAFAVAKATAESITVGAQESGALMGPVISKAQWIKIQGLIEQAIKEGATVLAGGLGKPAGLETGYFVKPTVLGYSPKVAA
jgi:aldehyde dehydrogenase (NAD+)